MAEDDIVAALRAVLPADGVLASAEERRPYECDALTAFKQVPRVVVLPRTEAEVQAVLLACSRLAVPVVARGSGTGLSGGATPHPQGVLLSLSRMNRILEIDPAGRTARLQPGVPNLRVSEAAAVYGLYYAPDPSSQVACSIGGNVAENSGGVHCLNTAHRAQRAGRARLRHRREANELGSRAADGPGLDLLALTIGSEGLLMVVTEVIVKLIPRPPCAQLVMASFPDVHSAANAVAAVIGAGIIPAALEMMDRKATAAVEPFVRAGYDLAAAAILVVVGGTTEVADQVAERRARRRCQLAAGFGLEAERLRFWSGARTPPGRGTYFRDYYCMDGTIPRSTSGGCWCHRAHGAALPAALHEGLPRRRWQPAPGDPLRCQRAGLLGTGRALRRGDPRAVRGTWRHHHRRTRRRAGEDQLHVRAVLSGRAGGVLRGEGGL
jgi:glycolate oxidase